MSQQPTSTPKPSPPRLSPKDPATKPTVRITRPKKTLPRPENTPQAAFDDAPAPIIEGERQLSALRLTNSEEQGATPFAERLLGKFRTPTPITWPSPYLRWFSTPAATPNQRPPAHTTRRFCQAPRAVLGRGPFGGSSPQPAA